MSKPFSIMTEFWKDIEFGNGRYSVSNFGNVKNNETGKLLLQFTQNSGYRLVHLYYNGKRKASTVHRLVAIAFLNNTENKEQIDHIDCNKQNNILSNLRWVTIHENMKHASLSGRMINVGIKAKGRMKAIGAKYGFENSQKHLIKAIPIKVTIGSETHEFESTRKAYKFLKMDHKTFERRIRDGIFKVETIN